LLSPEVEVTRLLSNIIKWNYINLEKDEKRVIDSDSRGYFPEDKGEEKTQSLPPSSNSDLFVPVNFNDNPVQNEGELTEAEIDALLGDSSAPKEDGFTQGMAVVNYDEMFAKERERIKEEAEQILADANAQAEQIVNDANAQAEGIKDEAYKEGVNTGRKEGLAMVEEDRAKMLSDIENQRQEMEQQMQGQIDKLEPFFAELSCALIEKITGIVVEQNKEVILHLLDIGLSETGRSERVLINVSSEDFEFVNENFERFLGLLKEGTKLEILEDNSLTKGQCLIEADSRVINSGIDVALKKLTDNLRILGSC